MAYSKRDVAYWLEDCDTGRRNTGRSYSKRIPKRISHRIDRRESRRTIHQELSHGA